MEFNLFFEAVNVDQRNSDPLGKIHWHLDYNICGEEGGNNIYLKEGNILH